MEYIKGQKIISLHYYPIKSLGGITTDRLTLNENGVEYDRHWMLIDENNIMISQRDIPKLTLFDVERDNDNFRISYNNESLDIPLSVNNANSSLIPCDLFGQEVYGLLEEMSINDWFSNLLNREIRLVRISNQWKREVIKHPDTFTNFTDSQQLLIIGSASLDLLNSHLENKITAAHFRPNIVIQTSTAHIEDDMTDILIDNIHLTSTKKCARCIVTTVDIKSGTFGSEPLSTLSKYRLIGNKIYFGNYYKTPNDQQEKTIQLESKITYKCK